MNYEGGGGGGVYNFLLHDLSLLNSIELITTTLFDSDFHDTVTEMLHG